MILAMESCQFMDDSSIKTLIFVKGFPIAMFDYQHIAMRKREINQFKLKWVGNWEYTFAFFISYIGFGYDFGVLSSQRQLPVQATTVAHLPFDSGNLTISKIASVETV